jgi:RNA polymerase sigma-70 factor (ECF subfamily)
MMDTDHLWERVQKGDMSAFRQLHETFHAGLCHYAMQILHDRFCAEETVQDVFFRIWEMRGALFSRDGSLKTYLYRLVHNQCMDLLKSRKTEKAGMVRLLPSEAWAAISEKYQFDEYIVEKLETEETVALVKQIIETLPAQCRDIFVQSRMEDKTNEEIARQMGLSVNTVRTQLYRAIQKIRKALPALVILFSGILGNGE